MRIIRDNKAGTFTFVPTEPIEISAFDQLVNAVKKGDEFAYGGRENDGNSNEYLKIHLHFGSVEVDDEKVDGNITIRKKVHKGGTHLLLQGSSAEDKKIVNRIRDICYFGSGGLIFLETALLDNATAFVFTAKFCKHCQAPMIDRCSCEWSTCGVCAAKCEHVYVRGLVHGGSAGDGGVGEFCGNCGRCKPSTGNEPKMTAAERHLQVEQELGIEWRYKDTPLRPADIVELEKWQRESKD